MISKHSGPQPGAARLRIAAILLSATLVAVPAHADIAPDDVTGTWVTEQKEPGDPFSHVEIFEKNGRYAGRIVWLSQPLYRDDEDESGRPRRDRENPDEALRDRPILGLEIMHSFRFDDGDGKWVDGRIYDPENGKEYRCKVTMKDPDTLEIFGYVKVGFVKLGRNTRWVRHRPDASP